MSSDFVHLHVHTEFSMLDGLNKIPPLVEKAKEMGMPALAVTDHGGMYGALHFYNACLKADIKPIIGLEAYLAKNSRFDKQTKMGSDQFHLTLLAQTTEGYKNLMKLVSISNLEGFSYKPRIDREVLFQHNEGIIVTTGCMASLFNRLLSDGKDEEALALFQEFKEVFPGRFYVEIQRHPAIEEMAELTKKQIAIARKLDLPLVATNDVHYLHQEDALAQDALLCVQTRKLMSDEKRMTMFNSPDFHLRSPQEMTELFHDYPEAIKNTMVIAEQCNVDIQRGQLIFPKFPLPPGETENSYLDKLVFAGLKRKFPEITPEIEERARYELGIIQSKGYSAYFLITQDFVNWAKNQGIAVGPGRGSAAGSLVSYGLNITTINPFQHELRFERFLNPSRPTPPDIDMDFADNRRDEVINYIQRKYGEDHVAHVITFGRMEARVAVRDIGRVLGLPYEDPDKIAKLIPNVPGSKVSLSEAVKTIPELTEYYKQPKFKKLIDLAKKVEGVVRHSSVHAAAVIIADKPLPEYVPIQKDSKTGKILTQYDMYVLDCNVSSDALGLIKFDFLGLRNLSIIEKALQLIKVHKNVDVDLNALPLDDKKTFELLSSGETMGVFQLESAGMRRVAKSLKPSVFSDITALVALYRPGPMDLIPTFIEGKHNPDKVAYPDDTLKPVLEETYGIMVYQEQVMQIFSVMAGYSLAEADEIRRAIGKKKRSVMDKNKSRFIEESVKKGYKKEVADRVWGFVEAFANYGFPKAHAASYAMIAYQTAYLKANYPVEYMTALMSVEAASHSMNSGEKIAHAIENCRKMNIKVLPPDINKSRADFTLEPHPDSLDGTAIRFGFSAIKNVGTAAIENILETQKKVGDFSSLTQFLHETDSRKVNKKVLESLIKVGSFDHFGTRASMLENLDDIRNRAGSLTSEVEGQDHLFMGIKQDTTQLQDTFAKLPEYPRQELLSFEQELLGLYLTEHPMAQALKAVSKQATKSIGDLDHTIHQDQTFLFGGVITRLRQVVTKTSGKPMAFGLLEDATGKLEFVAFPQAFEKYGTYLQQDQVVLVKAKVDYRDEELKLIVEKVSVPSEVELSHEGSSNHKEIFIPRKTTKETLEKVGALLKSKPGSQTVVILIPNGEQPKRMLLPYTVEWSKELEVEVQALLA
ncbi:MAG TPA: DNA polymerase III subunit alpha [Patescibacteria group bacterium]